MIKRNYLVIACILSLLIPNPYVSGFLVGQFIGMFFWPYKESPLYNFVNIIFKGFFKFIRYCRGI